MKHVADAQDLQRLLALIANLTNRMDHLEHKVVIISQPDTTQSIDISQYENVISMISKDTQK
jgi:hypothetical protein